jgi:DNA mismatch repair protein MSH3
MGATDNLSRNASTFMMELSETSDIMRLATPRSLVILDELGRGTSTHDGMHIAFASLFHFITTIRSLTLFVTHYPSLGSLARHPVSGVVPWGAETVRNYHMGYIEDTKDNEQNIVFLYKLVPGVASKSFGLNVARLAHLPPTVIKLAREKSEETERKYKNNLTLTAFRKLWKWTSTKAQGNMDLDGLRDIILTLNDGLQT